jgi:bifunctional oligoribonuclease and PAP phosphatase NrnA
MQYGSVTAFLERNTKLVITAHETPDADALGAEFAMLRALLKLGKAAFICNADPAPENLSFVEPLHQPLVLTSEQQLPADIAEHALLILDVNDVHNLGSVGRLVLPRVREYFIIDHHDSETDLSAPNHIEQGASSTCEILYLLFQDMGVPLDLSMAQALFMGIVFDTGSFIYPKTTALTFRIAHELVAFGVSPNQVYSNLYESHSLSSLVLMSHVLSSLSLHCGGRVAIQSMPRRLLEKSQARYEEADQFINIPLRSKEVRVSIFFKQNAEGLWRCSLRSKGPIDVARIARGYGGGGHRTAAGFKYTRPTAAVQAEILEGLEKQYFS